MSNSGCAKFFPKRKEGPFASYCAQCGAHKDSHSKSAALPSPPSSAGGISFTPLFQTSSRPASPAPVAAPVSAPKGDVHPCIQRGSPALRAFNQWSEADARHAAMAFAPDLDRILVPENLIVQRVKELAAEINAEYAGKGSLLVIGVLKGGYMFLSELVKNLTIEHAVDFMVVSSYGKSTKSGEVNISLDVRSPIYGRHVLVVEDMIDTGKTMRFLKTFLQLRQPASIKMAVLCRKVGVPGSCEDLVLEWNGFDLPNVWLVGMGMDYAERFRSYPFIAELGMIHRK